MLRKISFTLPFMVAIFTAVTLYSANAERIDPGQIVMPLIFGLLVAGIFLLLFWLLKWTSQSAPFISALFTAVFLLWHIIALPVDILILVATLVVGILSKHYTKYASLFFSTILVVAILASGVQAIITNSHKIEASNSLDYVYKPGQPNIYFIIPDRMPSIAAMRESGIDPDSVVTELRGMGFYINENQLSADPYTIDWPDKIYTTRTMRYFASVLNGGIAIPMDIPYQDCRTMIKDNALFTWLHEKGYKISNFPSWFTETAHFTDADINQTYTDVSLIERFYQDELGEAYLDRTILRGLNLRAWQTGDSMSNMEVRRQNWQSQKITEIAKSQQSSQFVTAHFTLPHEPYVYGNPKDSIPEQYYANVRAALTFFLDLAKTIHENDPTAIIIIQSDEGMAYRKPPELNYNLSKTQWSGVFTAWYIPGYQGNLNIVSHTEILNIVVR